MEMAEFSDNSFRERYRCFGMPQKCGHVACYKLVKALVQMLWQLLGKMVNALGTRIEAFDLVETGTNCSTESVCSPKNIARPFLLASDALANVP